MSTYNTQAAASKPAEVEVDLVAQLQAMRASLDELVKRMKDAMAAIAEANGADTCGNCGEYTRETFMVEDVDEDGRSWGESEFCSKCDPRGYSPAHAQHWYFENR